MLVSRNFAKGADCAIKEALNMEETNVVTVRWFDGYLEEFEATEVRFGSDLLWIRLKDGKTDISR